MNSSSLRHVLLKSCFPTAFLVATILAILDLATLSVLGQVRTPTVTVYVTVVQTVPIYVPVTAYVTVASIATSVMTLTMTAVSLGTVTLWNTVSLWNTLTTTAAGILGPIPASIFGQYSDVALVGGGVLGGVAAGAASSIVAARRKYRRLRLDGRLVARLDESLIESAHLAAELKGMAERLRGPLAERGATAPSLTNEYQTTFENFDQKANQLFEILGQVVKDIKERQSAVLHGFP